MTDNESKGERWPTVQFGAFPKQNGARQIWVDIGPNVFSLYPEYLTDPMITFCPSDAQYTQHVEKSKDPVTGEFCFGYAGNTADECAQTVDASYIYMGWAFDRLGCEYGTEDANQLLGLLSGLPSVDASLVPDSAEGPPQLVLALTAMVLNQDVVLGLLNNDNSTIQRGVDRDISSDELEAAQAGNGGGNTVYRLREGIERFLINDINNPAATAQAQSTLWVMMDQAATSTGDFNHIPGGCNVLYLDGHVDFVRYQDCPGGTAPVTGPMARILGMVAALTFSGTP